MSTRTGQAGLRVSHTRAGMDTLAAYKRPEKRKAAQGVSLVPLRLVVGLVIGCCMRAVRPTLERERHPALQPLPTSQV
jgi:hypothetical protein